MCILQVAKLNEESTISSQGDAAQQPAAGHSEQVYDRSEVKRANASREMNINRSHASWQNKTISTAAQQAALTETDNLQMAAETINKGRIIVSHDTLLRWLQHRSV